MARHAPALLLSPQTLEGVGAVRTAALKLAGIDNLAGFLTARSGRLAELCDAGEQEVQRWLAAATLLRLAGMTPALADALAREGVSSVAKLADLTLAGFEMIVRRAHDAGRLAKAPTAHALANLMQSAWQGQDTGMLAGRIVDPQGKGVAAAVVDIGRQEMQTDEQGWYAFDRAPAEMLLVRIELPGWPLPIVAGRQTVAADRLAAPVTWKFPVSSVPKVPVKREIDGEPMVHVQGTRLQVVSRPLEELPADDLLEVREIDAEGTARLLSFYRERTAHVLRIVHVRAAASQMPATTKVGDVLAWKEGRLQQTEFTPGQVQAMRRLRTLTAAGPRSRRVVKVAI